MKGLLVVAVVWLLLLVVLVSAALGRHLGVLESLGMALPVLLLFGVWAVGFLLSPARREHTQRVFSRLSRGR